LVAPPSSSVPNASVEASEVDSLKALIVAVDLPPIVIAPALGKPIENDM
jgi:hypothetical protein